MPAPVRDPAVPLHTVDEGDVGRTAERAAGHEQVERFVLRPRGWSVVEPQAAAAHVDDAERSHAGDAGQLDVRARHHDRADTGEHAADCGSVTGDRERSFGEVDRGVILGVEDTIATRARAATDLERPRSLVVTVPRLVKSLPPCPRVAVPAPDFVIVAPASLTMVVMPLVDDVQASSAVM